MSCKNALMNSLDFKRETSFFGFKGPSKILEAFMYGGTLVLVGGCFLKKKIGKVFLDLGLMKKDKWGNVRKLRILRRQGIRKRFPRYKVWVKFMMYDGFFK